MCIYTHSSIFYFFICQIGLPKFKESIWIQVKKPQQLGVSLNFILICFFTFGLKRRSCYTCLGSSHSHLLICHCYNSVSSDITVSGLCKVTLFHSNFWVTSSSARELFLPLCTGSFWGGMPGIKSRLDVYKPSMLPAVPSLWPCIRPLSAEEISRDTLKAAYGGVLQVSFLLLALFGQKNQ